MGEEREVRPMLTLLSSGCTLHRYKEEGACLPVQQTGWGQYTSVKEDEICDKLGLVLNMEFADTFTFHFNTKKKSMWGFF